MRHLELNTRRKIVRNAVIPSSANKQESRLYRVLLIIYKEIAWYLGVAEAE